MKVAVTGGSGQLGTLVLRRLVDDRSVKEVVVLDRRPPLVSGGKLRFVEVDVRAPDLERHLEGCEGVIHLAFMLARHAERSLVDSVNVGGSQNVFRAAIAAGARTIVYASSVAAYGVVAGHPIPIVESTPRVLRDDFAYSATKFRVEEHLDQLEPRHPDVAFARLRPVILVGRDMDHPLGSALRWRSLPDAGEAPFPMVWDEDVADAVILALEKRARGAFNLAADEALPVAELARRTGFRLLQMPRAALQGYARVSGVLDRLGLARRVDPAWLDPAPPMVASSERAKAELGWKPRCPTNVAVLEHLDRVVPRFADPRIPLFLWTSAFAVDHGLASVDLTGFDSRIHFCLTGPRGGDFTLALEGRRIRPAFGAPRPATSTVTLPATLLFDLLAGKADVATAQLTGKLRFQGEGHAALVVGGMIAGFRALAGSPGLRGRGGRAMARLFGGGGA